MSSHTVSLEKQDRDSKQVMDLPTLANRIMAHVNNEGDGRGLFPSERELAKQFNVSRHAVRLAINHLRERDAISRLPGRGMVSVSNPITPVEGKPALRCINVLLGSSPQSSMFQWLFLEYLAAYTEVLDFYDIKSRLIYWEDGRSDFEAMFWANAPRADQACVLVNRRAPQLLAWLNEQNVPYVVQNNAAYDDTHLPPHHRVYVNKMGAAYDATKGLLELGHRRIGFVGQMPSKTALWPEYEGYSAAMRCAGLNIRSEDCLHVVSEELPVVIGPCRDFLSRSDRPTAVFGTNGAAARGLVDAAKELSLNVPGDVSIIGMTGPLTVTCPDLSVIEVPRHELAKTAVEMVLQLAKSEVKLPLQNRVLNCKIAWRGSTAAPANKAGV